MGTITGTYDVIIVAFHLPRQQILQLLPESVKQKEQEKTFSDIPTSVTQAVLKADAANKFDSKQDHLVVLQLGYQMSTGPGPDWLPKLSFSECKLEVPFLQHPSGKSKKPLTYKQTILFSNLLIKIGSTMSGITSKLAEFEPGASPSIFAPEADIIQYDAEDYLASKSTRQSDIDKTSPSWEFFKNHSQDWWFAVGTEDKVQSFDFELDNPLIGPEAYKVEVALNLAAFAPESSSDTNSLSEIKFEGLGWRSRAKFVSKASDINQLE
ncbi:uncharacterized protein FA14DRAFT_186820 [Meira miltonrushii]|uniref:Uncharacterized protein n=1 Tax=Meira miltonrushii TaxID=1280837 RepID=A0A316VG59_9BASI|nr:uncharacterized protein FA14DRAFT_186820 [Meira miltonrushii]PWN36617.1 hypothetical protein FA14DRAFT_186820 [Meira miltonrushii]